MAELIVTTATGPLVPLDVTFNDVKVNGTLTAPSFSVAPTTLTTSTTASGIWAAPQPCQYTVTYIGTPGVTSCMVTVTINSVTSPETTASFITLATNLPANLIPDGDPNYAEVVIDGGTTVNGYVEINSTNGEIIIQTITNSGSFSGAGVGGFPTISFSYVVLP
jgi:hypothetical protein